MSEYTETSPSDDANDMPVMQVTEHVLLVDKKNTKYGADEQEKPVIILPVKKRKVETVKRQRAKNIGVSQKQCKLSFPPCRVCLGPGTGLHYGVNSCESCKSFFRRCLTRKEEYKCSKDKNCPVTSQVRGNCSGCRYKRCLEVGMSREAACLGRYTLSRRTKTIMEAKGEEYIETNKFSHGARNDLSTRSNSPGDILLQPSRQDIPFQSSPIIEVVMDEKSELSVKVIRPDISQAYLEELELIEKLVVSMEQVRPFGSIVSDIQIKAKLKEDYDNFMAKAQVFGKMKPVPQDEYFALLESTGIDIDGRQEFLRQSAMSCQPVLHSYIAFANIVPGFSSLSLEDQCSLLKTSHFEVFLFLTYKGYDPNLQMILTETGKAYHIDQAADIFYSRNLIDSIFDVCKKIQALDLTKEETALLLAIAVTFGDRCQLEDSTKVDEIQLRVVQIFRSFLKSSRPNDSSKFFTKIVDCFIAMRAVNDQYLKEYGVICQDKLVQKEAPIWLAYINAKTVQQGNQEAHSDSVSGEEQTTNEES
ncbi:vitamin D3 receptor-like [Mya arenaria]|uniref:vitamin D3 receptor-like n=1 Tax=Mya arenaria TaxID=6604 RepID=UPI0022E510E4|nr:vitamin D3 receptor-like [Mya arenaria]